MKETIALVTVAVSVAASLSAADLVAPTNIFLKPYRLQIPDASNLTNGLTAKSIPGYLPTYPTSFGNDLVDQPVNRFEITKRIQEKFGGDSLLPDAGTSLSVEPFSRHAVPLAPTDLIGPFSDRGQIIRDFQSTQQKDTAK